MTAMPKTDTRIRPITPEDDPRIAAIIRANLEERHLDIPGTAYFDPELDHLSQYYHAKPEQRLYLIAEDETGQVLGGVGVAEFAVWEGAGEIQKLYLSDRAKGRGLGRLLMEQAESFARQAGYARLYLETHSSLEAAIGLYERLGFLAMPKPDWVLHGTMDCFYQKPL